MRRRSMITFIIVNILVSLGVVLGVLSVLEPQSEPAQPQVITVPVVYTPTRGPTQTPFIITVIPTGLAVLPTGIVGDSDPAATEDGVGGGAAVVAATLDEEILSADAALQGTATALPENCIIHVVKEGDTPFGIAEQYGTDGFTLMEVNGMDEVAASSMQIGDALIVPLEGCTLTAQVAAAAAAAADIDATAEATSDADATGEATGEATEDGTPRPTPTLPPTATTAQMEILRVISPGDVTVEGVEIRNNGDTVNISGWTLTDADGNEFVFPQQLLFSNAQVTVYTRSGQTTAIAFFWGQDTPVWQPGDTVTLTDANNRVQSTFRVAGS
jgi:hypothetical protein